MEKLEKGKVSKDICEDAKAVVELLEIEVRIVRTNPETLTHIITIGSIMRLLIEL